MTIARSLTKQRYTFEGWLTLPDAVEGVPELVIEILSLRTRDNDLLRGRKWLLYQRCAVPHYWLVDPESRTVIQYRYRDGR